MPKTTRAIVVHELRKQIPALVSLGALIVFAATVNIITPLLFKALVDGAIPAKDLGQVLWLLVGMVSASLLGIVLSALQNYQRAKVGEAVTQGLRQSLFDHAIRVRLSALEKLKVGEIVHRIKLSCGEWTCPHDRGSSAGSVNRMEHPATEGPRTDVSTRPGRPPPPLLKGRPHRFHGTCGRAMTVDVFGAPISHLRYRYPTLGKFQHEELPLWTVKIGRVLP